MDADFLGTWIAPTTFTRQFHEGRKNIKIMSKLVAFDSNYSLTGSNADIRVRIKPSQQIAVVNTFDQAEALGEAVAAQLRAGGAVWAANPAA